ncbi:MAG: hypothetical protein ACKVP0_14080 [Pirellulaceae bacterium]
MKWVWKIEPLDPATVTPEEIVAEVRRIESARWAGGVVGIIAAVGTYFFWNSFGIEQKWVEYTILPAIVIFGTGSYRLVYEIAIRFRP